MDLQHIEEVEAQLAVARAELRKLEDSNKRLTGQLISFQHAAEVLPLKDRELREVRMEIAGIQRDLEAAQANMRVLEATNQQLQAQAEAAAMRSPYFQYTTDIGAPLYDPMAAWQTSGDDKQDREESPQDTPDDSSAVDLAVASAAMVTEAAVAASAEHVQRAEAAMQRAVEERNAAQATVAELGAELESAQAAMASLDVELQSALAKLCEQRIRLNVLESEKATLLGNVDELLDKLVSMTARLNVAQEEAAKTPALQAAVDAAQTELSAMIAEVDRLHMQLNESRLQLTNIARTIEAVMAIEEGIDLDNPANKEEARLVEALHQANEERADLREQLDEVAATLMGRLRGQLQEREAQLAAACEANSSANQRVQHYLAEIARLEGVVSELQGSALSKEPAGGLADDDADAIVVGSDTQQEQ